MAKPTDEQIEILKKVMYEGLNLCDEIMKKHPATVMAAVSILHDFFSRTAPDEYRALSRLATEMSKGSDNGENGGKSNA